MVNAATPRTNQVVRSYMVLRNAIGVIAVGLTFVVFLGNWIIFSHHRFSCLLPVGNQLPDSLSGYYYSHMRDVFVAGMCATGVFLIFYRGDDLLERWLTNAAGAFAVAIALFPTSHPNVSPGCGPATMILRQPAPHESAIAWVHTLSLIGLMSSIAWVLWRYARDHSEEQKRTMVREDQDVERNPALKSRHRKWYIGCIIAIGAAGAFAAIQDRVFSDQLKHDAPWLLYAELVAFVAFGVAWFVKGGTIDRLHNGVRSAKAKLGGVIHPPPSKDTVDA